MRLGRFFSLGFSAALLVGLLGGSDAAFAQANGPALDAPAAPGAAEELPAPEAVADPAKAKPAARPAEANPLAPAAARPRRYFGRWEKSPNGAYFSKKFYYRPDPNGAAEKRQYVVFYPSSLDYLYLFDPEARVYWGRFDRFAPPDVCFQAIAQNEQRTRLWDIPEPAYGKSGPLPRLPGAVDDLRLLSPTETPALLDPQDAPD
ncbi:MAG TPA: hypothetical protein VGE52_21540, partial [Pirellulales bacterium]